MPGCLQTATIDNAVGLDGKLFIFHGQHMSIYNTACDSWKLLNSTPTTGQSQKAFLQAVVWKGSVVVMARCTFQDYDYQLRMNRDFTRDEIHVYSQTHEEWKNQKSDFPVGENNAIYFCFKV
jgi:hypothetical protein